MNNDDFILDPSHQDLDELQLDAERKLFQKEGSKRNKKKTLRTGGKKYGDGGKKPKLIKNMAPKAPSHEGMHKAPANPPKRRKLKRGGKK